MRAVNLLPRDFDRGSETSRAPLLVLVGGLAVVTVAAGALLISARGAVSDRRADLAAAESALSASTPSSESAPAQGVVVQERANRVAALSAALSSRLPLDALLHDLAFVLPRDAWLTGLSATSAEDAAPRTAGTTGASGSSPAASAASSSATSVTIEGATFTQEAVARVLARLSVLPSLDDVRLTKSERVQLQPPTPQAGGGAPAKTKGKRPKSIVTFSVTASLARGRS